MSARQGKQRNTHLHLIAQALCRSSLLEALVDSTCPAGVQGDHIRRAAVGLEDPAMDHQVALDSSLEVACSLPKGLERVGRFEGREYCRRAH